MAKDYYQILGIDREADDKTIKSAYRSLARKWHPDVNPDNTEEAEEKFKEVSEAYSVLSDPEKKKLYDATGSTDPRTGGFKTTGDPFDIFRTHFSGMHVNRDPNPPMRGQSLRLDTEISLKESLFGGQRQVEYHVQSGCESCNGKGGTEFETCSNCKGSGFVVQQRPGMMMQSTCGACQGRGEKVKAPCPSCSGRGVIHEKKQLTVVIPAGIRHGNTMRLQGQGGAGFNGGPRGDVLLGVAVTYPELDNLNEEERGTLERLLSK